MKNVSDVIKASKKLSENQKSIIRSLFESELSLPIHLFENYNIVIPRLQSRGIIQLKEDRVSLTNLGQAVYKFYSRSLATIYPERVAELWDYEKNGDLKPEDVFVKATKQYLWFKCPIDGHSWKKKVSDITDIWKNNGTSGCPACAGKTKQPEKQSSLLEVYVEFVQKYWDYEKNREINLDPAVITLGSNKKAYFKCPHDCNEWQSSIASTILQQWSKGNAGCRVCNGTIDRERGEWKNREPIAVEFPDEVATYWLYEVNNKSGIDPLKLTTGSKKKASFKCPTCSHEWVASPSQIQSSWIKGNSGCPACRRFVVIKTTSLISIYPDRVAQHWDYDKNNETGIYPDKFPRGSNQEAWFKCPIDGYEWKTRIGSITRRSWNLGNSGCARCFGWNLDAIRQFVASLEVHIPNLTQAELYKIFEQSGVLSTQNAEGLKIVKDIIKGKLTGQKLRDVI
jgi:transcription elongation factor Elf1